MWTLGNNNSNNTRPHANTRRPSLFSSVGLVSGRLCGYKSSILFALFLKTDQQKKGGRQTTAATQIDCAKAIEISASTSSGTLRVCSDGIGNVCRGKETTHLSEMLTFSPSLANECPEICRLREYVRQQLDTKRQPSSSCSRNSGT